MFYVKLINGLLSSVVMAGAMSGLLTYINGRPELFFINWGNAFIIAWPAAFILGLTVQPLIAKLAVRISGSGRSSSLNAS